MCYQIMSSKSELYRIQLFPGKDLVLRTADNPCTELIHYCNSFNISSTEYCVRRFHHKMQNEILTFSKWMNYLHVDEQLFMRCKEFHFNDNSIQKYSDFYEEMLGVLLNGPSGDRKTLQLFDLRRSEVKLNPYEELDLFSKAIVLHPNSTYIISQFGLALREYGQMDVAESLFSDAVNRGLWPNTMQRPEWSYIPQNISKPWHDPKDFSFVSKIEAGYDSIRREYLHNLNHRHISLSEDLSNKNAVFEDNLWKTLYLKHPGAENYTAYSKFFPETMKILKSCSVDFIEVKYSAIQPGTHIKPHTGPSNDRLRCHLALVHTGGAMMRVGNEWKTWTEGKVTIFDSSWEHEVYHNGPDLRIVLIFDIRNYS